MASFPLQNYSSEGKSLWLRNSSNLILSTITANTVNVDGPNNININLTTSVSTAAIIAEVPDEPGFASQLSLLTLSSATIKKELDIAVSGTTSNAAIAYSIDGDTVGLIGFVSSFNGAGGGVQLVGKDNTSVTVGNQTFSVVGNAGGILNDYIPDQNNAFRQFYSGTNPYTIQSQIFHSAPNNSISLISGQAGSGGPYLTVDTNGVVIYPGASNSVFFANGYLNMNSNALSNVSSINGVAYPPPVTPFVPVTFDPAFAGSNAGYIVPAPGATLIASVAVETGKTYRISMNPTFNSTAAPAAGDFLNIYGSSGTGPNDTIDFVTLNLNWAGNGLTPGLANNYGQAVSGVMTADTTPYNIYGLFNPSCSVSTLVQFGQTNGIVVEKLF